MVYNTLVCLVIQLDAPRATCCQHNYYTRYLDEAIVSIVFEAPPGDAREAFVLWFDDVSLRRLIVVPVFFLFVLFPLSGFSCRASLVVSLPTIAEV